MTQSLEQILSSATADFAACSDAPSLENAKAKYLGKTGAVTELLKGMAALTPDEKKTRGAEINRVKHEALLLRRAVWPLREILNLLARADNGFFTADTRLYLRDIYDHTVHVLESLESVRDLLADLLDIYLSSVSNRLNTEVRILTVLTTLFMPATLIAGIFGMNFQTMPLLDEHDGFWIALATMLGAATVMAAAFWRRNWLRTK